MNFSQITSTINEIAEELLQFNADSTPEEYLKIKQSIIQKTKNDLSELVSELKKVYNPYDVSMSEEDKIRIKEEIKNNVSFLNREQAVESAKELKQIIDLNNEKIDDNFFSLFVIAILEVFDEIAVHTNPYRKEIYKIIKG